MKCLQKAGKALGKDDQYFSAVSHAPTLIQIPYWIFPSAECAKTSPPPPGGEGGALSLSLYVLLARSFS